MPVLLGAFEATDIRLRWGDCRLGRSICRRGVANSTIALIDWLPVLPLIILGAGLVGATPAYANPEGANVVAGGISIDNSIPKTLTINQSTGTAIINWNSFSIKLDETTNFIQPSSSSWTLNRVTGAAGDASPWRASALTGQAGCQDGRLQGRTGHRPVDRLLQHRTAPFCPRLVGTESAGDAQPNIPN